MINVLISATESETRNRTSVEPIGESANQ